MEQWKKFGNILGRRMSIVVPFCVAAGVIFPNVFGSYRALVPFFFAFMTFQNSLNNTYESVGKTFRHPANLVVILLTTTIVMPVLSHLLASILFAGNSDLIVGATLEYCVPVAVVSFMWTGIYGGDGALTLACILLSTVLSPFTIPFSLQLLLGATVEVDVLGMMSDMVFMIAAPALIGMLVNDLTHGWGHATLSPALAPAARILLMFICASNATNMADDFRNFTPVLAGMALYIFCFGFFGFALGLVIARVRKLPFKQLVSSCFCTGYRNISAGTVLASQFFGGSVVFPVMMGTLFQSIIVGIFGSYLQKCYPDETAE